VVPRLERLGLAVPVAAVDINRQAVAKVRGQPGLVDDRLCTSAERTLAEREADFITIVVLPASHEGMANLAHKAGCHILSEKPIGDTVDACCRIHRKVRGAGPKMAMG
jgi:predicted dehydrogenase